MAASFCNNFLIEVIACTKNDAEQAERGGADRLEIVQELAQDGLSPEPGLVEEIVRCVSIPVRVMVRPRNRFSGFRLAEIEQMRSQVTWLAESGVEGIVIGLLNENGDIDFRGLERILANKKSLQVTFHRAFDDVKNPEKSLLEIIQFGGIDRILTFGKIPDADDRLSALSRLNALAAGQINIIAGGGLSADNIIPIAQRTGIREFHFGRAVRTPAMANGVVCAEKIRKIKNILHKVS